MARRDSSAAYLALTGAARDVLALIEQELADNDAVAIRLVDFEKLGVPLGTCGYALRQVRLFGFVTVEHGTPPRNVNTFRLSTRWRSIDATEIARLQMLARKPEPKPQPVAKPRTPRRATPSLPVLRWLNDAR